MPAAANIHKLNACGLLIIKRLLIIDEEGMIIMIKVMLIRVLIIIEDKEGDQTSQCLSRPAAVHTNRTIEHLLPKDNYKSARKKVHMCQ